MKYLILITAIFLISCDGPVMVRDKQPKEEVIELKPSKGEVIFRSKCATCHKEVVDFTGPALSTAYQNWPDKKALYDFVRHPADAKKTKYVRKMFEDYKPTIMTDFPELTDEEIDAILKYCRDFVQSVQY